MIDNEIKPGWYQHHRGKMYRVLFTAVDTNVTDLSVDNRVVVYEDEQGHRYVRSVEDFFAQVVINVETKPRFEFVWE